jgi:fucose permease
MNREQGSDPKKQIALMLAAMVGFALFVSTRNILLPAFRQSFAIGNTLMGVLVFAFSLVFTISTYMAEGLCRRLGHKRVVVGALLIMTAMALILYWVESVLVFCLLFVGQAMLVAVLLFGLNTLVPLIAVRNQAFLMNVLHLGYSLGAMAMSKVIGIGMGAGLTWHQIYLIVAACLGLIALLNVLGRYPGESVHVQAHEEDKDRLTMRNPLLLTVIGAFAAAVVAETVVNQWFSNYMVESFSFQVSQAADVVFVYLVTHALGRLIGGFAVDRIGIQRSLVVYSTAACIITGTGIAMGASGLYMIAASGFFLSIVYPTSLHFAQTLFADQSARATSLVLTSISFINMFTGIAVGALNDLITPYMTLYLVPVMLIVSLAFHGGIRMQVRR